MAVNKYNLAFQERIIKDYKKGVKQKEIATKSSIKKSIVCQIIKQFNEGSPLEMKHKSERPHKTCCFTNKKIICHVKKNPFDNTNDTIRKLKLLVSKNIDCRWLPLSGLLKVVTICKLLHFSKESKS